MISPLFGRVLRGLAALSILVSGLVVTSSQAVNLTTLPPYLTETKGAPMVMLNLSRDHQLSYKAYNEFSDLDGDGIVETQYKHSYSYYGYFDNQRCYSYTVSNQYSPTRKVAEDGYCNYTGGSNEWSGNFLNWATMTRMDVVRRILYGGMRSTDSATTTVLERAHLPTDAHAFAKYYKSDDIAKLTPFSGETQITICNATFKNGTNQYSHNTPGRPLMLVARGNYSLWNSNERWQCYWADGSNTNNTVKSGVTNGNVASVTGIDAGNGNPGRSSALGTGLEAGNLCGAGRGLQNRP